MDHISIRVSTLRGDQKIGFDAYIQIDGKMILYLRCGDSFEGLRLKRLRDKKLRKMFINKEQEELYLAYLQSNIESAYDKASSKNIQNRAEIIQGSQQSHAENIFENPENTESYRQAREEASRYVSFIMENTESVNALMAIENSDKSVAHHGVNVSTMAVSLAQKLGIADASQMQMLALGALLHDFGHHYIQLDHSKPISSLSPAEAELWKSHPKLGAEQVQTKKHFDTSVMNIILQHEERANGTGPLGLIEKNQDPLATIVSTANTFDRLLSFEKIAKADIPKKMMLEYLGYHPLQHIQYLNELIKKI